MKKILVIDDDHLIRKSVCKVLQLEPYDVHAVSCGSSALKYLEQEKVDIVITDIYMPEKDGFEIIDELLKKFPEIKIIAMTGGFDRLFDPGTALDVAERSGAHYVIKKPCRGKEILKAVESVIDLNESL